VYTVKSCYVVPNLAQHAIPDAQRRHVAMQLVLRREAAAVAFLVLSQHERPCKPTPGASTNCTNMTMSTVCSSKHPETCHLRMTACCAPPAAATRRRPTCRAGPSHRAATPRRPPAARRRRTAASRRCPTCRTAPLTELPSAARHRRLCADTTGSVCCMQPAYASVTCSLRLKPGAATNNAHAAHLQVTAT